MPYPDSSAAPELPEDAITAARQAMDNLIATQADVSPTEAVTAILNAALPHIREGIARDIEGERDKWQMSSAWTAWTDAARITRGERP